MLYFKLNDLLHITDIWTFYTAYCKLSFIPLQSLNNLLQKHYLYGCSTQCMHWCIFRKPCSLNDLLHTVHVYGHFLLHMQWCLFRSPCFLKDLLYTSHLYRWSSLSMQLVQLQITLFSEWFTTNITHTYGRTTLFLHSLQMMQHPQWFIKISHVCRRRSIYAFMYIQITLHHAWFIINITYIRTFCK